MTRSFTTAEAIYLGAVGCYLLFFALFLRLFLWKIYAERNYWNRKPALSVQALSQLALATNRPLPRFSLLVPARDEAEVIERTVDHLSTMDYPPDLYEIVVVTDEKEQLRSDQRCVIATTEAARLLRIGIAPPSHQTETGSIILGLLSSLALNDGHRPQDPILTGVSVPILRHLVHECSARLLSRGERSSAPDLTRLLRTRIPELSDESLPAAQAALLSLSIPVALSFCRLRPNDARQFGASPTCVAVATRIGHQLRVLAAKPAITAALIQAFRDVHPTTQEIMERKVREYEMRPDTAAIKHLVVPPTFDGEYGGQCLDVEVPSTKGRALNYALSLIDGRSNWCGFFDAESRPDRLSMLYVAHRLLEGRGRAAHEPRIFQGPVFQVRNWYEMGPFCKIASLYQAIAHDWYLPALFRRLPFVGGTNLFIETRLLREIGGYDSSSLTEDLELGVRAYLKQGAWPEYLPYPSSEQTPPTFRGFYRQRLRWATGHLQVMSKIRQNRGYDEAKKQKLLRTLWFKGQGEWIFYQTATLVPPAIILLWIFDLVDPNVLGPGWHVVMNLLSTVYLGFTIYAFFRYVHHLDQAARPRRWLGQLGALAQLLVLPLAAFLFPVPYSSAMFLRSIGKGPQQWIKTPRTRE